jgi:hypothetical protein
LKQDSNFLYHQAALHLLDEKPVTLLEASAILQRLEHKRGIVLPVSVKEWYSLEHAEDILSRYPPAGTVRSVEQLGDPERYWSNGAFHEFDLLQHGLLLLMAEIQDTWFWAIQLNAEDDPPVVVSEELKPSATWYPYAETFSVFVYTCVWDSLVINPEDQMLGCKEFLLPTELDFLHERFQEGPRTYTFPGAVNYRFFSDNQRILVQESERQASWYFAAESDEALKQLVEQVLQCETLKRDLHLDRNGMTEWEFMFPNENEEV